MECDSSEMDKNTELSGRKRKKLFIKLRTQMEFYFSDSNLAKDKFLYNLICQDKDGYVDVEVFQSFNKIKALSEDINILAASVTKSNILELNESKSRVKRKTPIQISKDFDACTLYVEGLPPYADLKWLKDVFDHFGTVEYINIPRFNISQKIKGFAFIEFNDAESVKKACQFYRNLSDSDKDSTKKEGEVRKSVDNEDQNSQESKTSLKTTTPSKSEKKLQNSLVSSTISANETKSAANKRKLEGDDSESEKSHKKQKRHKETLPKSDVGPESEEVKKMDSKNNSNEDHSEMQEQNNAGAPSEEALSKSKKKRKHSKKNRDRHERPTLRVMSKSEWKTYRNKYLDLQRSTMSYLKKQILLECQELREQDNTVKIETMPKRELKFQPGVIIKISLSKPIENPSDMKEQIKLCAVVAYIDAPIGSDEVFIRCHATEDASSIIQDKKLLNLGNVKLLSGPEEEEYWEKIQKDRENKLNTPVARKRRGRDKLIAKAAKLVEQRNKHIYFYE